MNGRTRTLAPRLAAGLALLLGAAASPACSKEPRKTPESSAASAAPQASAASASPPSAKEVSRAPARANDPCAVVCERSRELGCPNQVGCAKACSEMVAMPVCKDELVTALRCFGMHPASGWECGENGLASIKDGLCNPEQERFVTCFEAIAPR